MRQMGGAMVDFIMAAHSWLQISESRGPEEIAERIVAMLDGEVSAKTASFCDLERF